MGPRDRAPIGAVAIELVFRSIVITARQRAPWRSERRHRDMRWMATVFAPLTAFGSSPSPSSDRPTMTATA